MLAVVTRGILAIREVQLLPAAAVGEACEPEGALSMHAMAKGSAGKYQ